MESVNSAKWLEAMKDEFKSLEKNQTWNFDEKPLGQRVQAASGSIRLKKLYQRWKKSDPQLGLSLRGTHNTREWIIMKFFARDKTQFHKTVVVPSGGRRLGVGTIDVNNLFTRRHG